MSPKPSLQHLLAVWRVEDRNLKRYKKAELELRKQIETLLLDQKLVPDDIGTFRIDIGEQDLKLTRKETRSFKFDKDKAAWLFQKLVNSSNGNINAALELMAQLFPTVIEADIKSYDMLSDDLKKLVNESGMLEIKSAQSSLEIVDKAKPKFEG